MSNHKLKKEVTRKEDGRYLIYYSLAKDELPAEAEKENCRGASEVV
ncbi:MAG: hypothetical protein AB1767_08185 [Bacillota bacterium]